MSARTAVETIQAAIEKLDLQRDASPGGPWRVGQSYMDNPTLQGCDDLGGRFQNEFASIDNIPAGDLIVTLRRTIDAQLAILKACAAAIEEAGFLTAEPADEVLDLARAILGEDS